MNPLNPLFLCLLHLKRLVAGLSRVENLAQLRKNGRDTLDSKPLTLTLPRTAWEFHTLTL